MIEIKVITDEMIDNMEFLTKSGKTIRYKLSIEEQSKIIKWLHEIQGNGEGIDTMNFPVLEYSYRSIGGVGYVFEVKEHITQKTLDLTDISRY